MNAIENDMRTAGVWNMEDVGGRVKWRLTSNSQERGEGDEEEYYYNNLMQLTMKQMNRIRIGKLINK